MRTRRQRSFDELRMTDKKTARSGNGFSLAELVVLVCIVAMLSGVLVADLTQTRAALLRQACAANLKH
jgi:type II secretory pathway pseudopilin PulG